MEQFTTRFKTTEKKMIGHRSRFQENGDLPLRRGPVARKKPPFSNARALIKRKIIRSRDAQCNTRECKASVEFQMKIREIEPPPFTFSKICRT